MLSKMLDQIRRLKTDAKKEIDKLESELATLRAEREITARLPVPKAEFLARVDALVEPPEQFPEQLAALLKPLQAPGRVPPGINPLGIDSSTQVVGGSVPNFSRPEPGSVSHYALQGLIGPTIRQALHQHAEAMPYPEEVGLPAEERRARLAQLDQEAAALEGRILELREELSAAGVRL